jgi:multicomponent Na+:H+ antiporter subunit E
MTLLLVNVALALAWSALSGQFSPQNLVVGYVLGYFTLYLTRGVIGETTYFRKIHLLLRFIVYFHWELLVANLRVARDVLWPGPLKIRPSVIAVPIDQAGEIGVTVLANVISLTPGTLTLDVSDDHRVLYVHVMNVGDPEAARQQIKMGFERLVLDLFEHETRPPSAKREEVES